MFNPFKRNKPKEHKLYWYEKEYLYCGRCGSKMKWGYYERGYNHRDGASLIWRRWQCSANIQHESFQEELVGTNKSHNCGRDPYCPICFR